MHSNHKTAPRRKFLQTACATLLSGALGAPMLATSSKARAAGNLVLVSWGGTYRDGVEKELAKPFEKEFGVPVTIIDTPDLAKVKAQVTTNNVQWDVFDAVGPMAMTGSKSGYWEPLDSAQFETKDLIAPMTRDAVPFFSYTGGICWDNSKFPDGRHPETFADLWNVTKFPGHRGLRNRVSETLEMALLADGVASEKIYPLDVERAFKSLDRIKPYVTNWIDQTPQTVALVESGQVDFSYTYSTRAKAAQDAGKPIQFSFKQNMRGLQYLVVLRNAPNKANAMKFVQFALRPDRQAALMDILLNTPARRSALPMMKPEARKWLPNPANTANVFSNDAWWADQYDELTLRFKEWVLS